MVIIFVRCYSTDIELVRREEEFRDREFSVVAKGLREGQQIVWMTGARSFARLRGFGRNLQGAASRFGDVTHG